MRNAKERGQNGMEKELLVRASLTVEETEKAGEELEFGGLLGTGPIMNINPNSSSKFISRGGQIPAPLQSLKN